MYQRSIEGGFLTQVRVYFWDGEKKDWVHLLLASKGPRLWLKQYPRTVAIHSATGHEECNLIFDYFSYGKGGDILSFFPVVLEEDGNYVHYEVNRKDTQPIIRDVYQSVTRPARADPLEHFRCREHTREPLTLLRHCFLENVDGCTKCRGHGLLGRCKRCEDTGHCCPVCLRSGFKREKVVRHLKEVHHMERFPVPIEVKEMFKKRAIDEEMEQKLTLLIDDLSSSTANPSPSLD
jgi:hypothetical protein